MNFPGQLKHEAARPLDASVKGHIGVLGAKGGVGSTTIAVNLAFTLSKMAHSDERVTLIDCNLQQPDAALMLACQPVHSIVELFSRAAHLDEITAEACCLPLSFSNNMRLLTPPLDGSAAAPYSLSDISLCLKAVSEFSNTNVLDLPNKLDRHLVTLLDLCQLIVLVIEPNMTSIAAGKRWLKIFAELGYHSEDLLIVVNRTGGSLKFVENQVNNSFPGVQLSKVPSLYTLTETCAIEGLPVTLKAPKHAYSRALQAVASQAEERMMLARSRSIEISALSTVN